MSRPAAGPNLRRTAWRVGLQTAGLLVACLLLVSGLVYLTVARSQNEQVKTTLAAAAATAGRPGDRDTDHDDPGLLLVPTAVLHDDDVQSAPGLPVGLPDVTLMRQVRASGEDDERDVVVPSGVYAVLTTVRDDGLVVQAAMNLREEQEERLRLLAALGLSSGVGVLLAAGVGAWLAGRAVRPMADALHLQQRFVADASHELRTPLTLLSTRAQLLRRRFRAAGPPTSAAGAAMTRDVDGIVADTGRLAAILEELLVAADTREPVPREPVDLVRLAAAATAAAQAEAAAQHVRLELVSDTELTLAQGSAPALGRALTALIDNALSHATSAVTVRVGREDGLAVVRVGDDGPGIPPEVAPRLFGRFVSDRGESAVRSGRRHYGLGLALVSEVARRHGGAVTAVNRADATGAEFRLSLPVGSTRTRLRRGGRSAPAASARLRRSGAHRSR
ncbi:MAG: Signal transduction histidine kinase [Friedmanniella sp.]|nr:Signal transduction histidine kinase [Friedmanniella sp.]